MIIKKAKSPLMYLFRRASRFLNPQPLRLSTSDKLLIASASVNSMRARRSDIKQLWDAEIKVFSQWGEDGIITYLLDSLGISKPKILEIGAGNFEECNSRFQAEFRNASVYLVDQRPDLKPNCQSLEVYWKTVILPFNDYVTPLNINSHISLAKQLLSGLDVFSLDIDGNDYWVLLDADLSDISIVVCEYNPLFGSKFSVTVPRDDHFARESKHFSWLYYGMSLRACVSLLQKKGFTFCGTNLAGNNAFFVNERHVKFLTLDVPPQNDFSKFTDWRIRESRDVRGKLSYLYGDKRFAEVKNLKVVNTDSNELVDLHSVV